MKSNFAFSPRRFVCLTLVLLGSLTQAFATTYYVDPVKGSASGNGSKSRPWSTLQSVVASGAFATNGSIKEGDTVLLLSGYHGEFVLSGGSNQQPITIAAAEGHYPKLKRVVLKSGRNWVFRGLTISPSFSKTPKKMGLIDLGSSSRQVSYITVDNCRLYSANYIGNWKKEDWIALACNGINVNGTHCKIINNRIRNIRFGIVVTSSYNLVSRNLIKNFSGDGIRGLGDYGTYEYNTVENAFKVDNNHDDGFQSWSRGPGGPGTGEVRGIVLRGNTFLNTTNPNQPLQGPFQGIGCFDGFFVDWVIENNVVSVNHYHGITLIGALDCIIRNNTVIDMNSNKPGPSWIRVMAHKDGTPSKRNLIVNNLSQSFPDDGSNSVRKSNQVVKSPAQYFVDPANYDFRLKKGSPAIDAALQTEATEKDIDQNTRGNKPDLGAFEYIK